MSYGRHDLACGCGVLLDQMKSKSIAYRYGCERIVSRVCGWVVKEVKGLTC